MEKNGRPGQPDPIQLYRDGIAHIENVRYQDAINSLSQSIEIDPENASAWSHRALAIIRRSDEGCFREALSDYNEAYRRSPTPVLAACIGYCEARLNQYPEAVSHLKESIREGVDSAEVFLLLGACQMTQTDFDAAEKSFDEALERNKESQLALFYRRRTR